MTGKLKWISLMIMALAIGLAGCASGGNATQEPGYPAAITGPDAGTVTAAPAGATGTAAPLDDPAAPTPEEAAAMAALASELIQADVQGQDGQPVGAARGMVLDPTAGLIDYLVVETDSKEGARQVLVPWQALAMNGPGAEPQTQSLRMTAGDDALAQAPDFTGGEFQGEASLDWDALIEKYWAGALPEVPVTGDEANAQPVTGLTSMPVLVGDLENGQELNFEVQDSEGNRIGTLVDAVVSGEGQVAYALLEPDPATNVFNCEAGQAVVSWKALGWNPDSRVFMLAAPAEALSGAPCFDTERRPDLSLPGWDQEWSAYWDSTELRGPDATAAAVTPSPEGTTTPQPETSSQGNSGQVGGSQQPSRIPTRMSRLVDQEVTANSGEVLGTVSDVVFAPSGVVEYVVLNTLPGPGQGQGSNNSAGRGNSGEGNRARGINQGGSLVPVPWSLLRWEPENDRLIFTRQVMVYNNAPSFEGRDTFGLEEDWWQESTDYWRTFAIMPTADAIAGENLRRQASDVLGKPARGPQEEDLGSVEDILVVENGVVRFLILRDSPDGALRAVPWEYFSYENGEGSLLYTDDVERLQEAPTFQAVEDLDEIDAGEMDGLMKHWGMR